MKAMSARIQTTRLGYNELDCNQMLRCNRILGFTRIRKLHRSY